MSDLTEQRLREMLESAAGNLPNEPKTSEEKAGAYYRSFMDEAQLESLGEKAIQPELDEIRAAKTRSGLARLMGKTATDFEGSLSISASTRT